MMWMIERRMRPTSLLALIAWLLVFSWLPCPAEAAFVEQTWVRFGATAGETLATGNVVCLKDADGKAYKADANDAALQPAAGIVGKGGAAGAEVEIITIGILGGFSGLAEGGTAYLSETAGAITQTAPTWAQPLGVALSTTEYFFNFHGK